MLGEGLRNWTTSAISRSLPGGDVPVAGELPFNPCPALRAKARTVWRALQVQPSSIRYLGGLYVAPCISCRPGVGLCSESDDSVFGVVELQSVRAVGELRCAGGRAGSTRAGSIRVRRCAPGVGRFGEVGIGRIVIRSCPQCGDRSAGSRHNRATFLHTYATFV